MLYDYEFLLLFCFLSTMKEKDKMVKYFATDNSFSDSFLRPFKSVDRSQYFLIERSLYE